MRKSFAITLTAAVGVVYSLCAYVTCQFYSTDKRAVAPLAENLLTANIAIDKVLYGNESLFEAREETALGYTKLANREPEAARKHFERARSIRDNRTDIEGDERLRAIYNLMAVNTAQHRGKDNVALAEQAVTIALENHNPDCDQIPKALQVCARAYDAVQNEAQAQRYRTLLQQWTDLQADAAALQDEEKPDPVTLEADLISEDLVLPDAIMKDAPKVKLASAITMPPSAVPAAPPRSVAVSWVAFEPISRTDIYAQMRERAEQRTRKPHSTPLEQGRAFAELAEVYRSQSWETDAREAAKMALRQFQQANYQGKEFVIATLDSIDLGDQKAEDAEKQATETLRRLEKLPACKDPLLHARVLEALVKADPENASEHLESALALRRKELGDDNIIVARTMLALADLYDRARAESMRNRAGQIARRLWVADFRKYGPASIQILEDSRLCSDAGLDGFDESRKLQLATLERIYGKNSAAAAGAAADEASEIQLLEQPKVERKPAPATLAFYLFLLTSCAWIFLSLKTFEAKRTKFDYDKRWKYILPVLSVVCGILLGCGMIIGKTQSTNEWRVKKRYELLSRAIAGYEAGHVQNADYGDACFLASYLVPDGPNKNQEREKALRKAITAYEKDRGNRSIQMSNVKDAYSTLAELVEDKDPKEADALRAKAEKVKADD